jgi:hypothetical protein
MHRAVILHLQRKQHIELTAAVLLGALGPLSLPFMSLDDYHRFPCCRQYQVRGLAATHLSPLHCRSGLFN